jgi:arylsulfatase A-like enzyme
LPKPDGHQATLRQGDEKLLREPTRDQTGPWQLYYLAGDLGETNHLATREPTRLADLTAA